MMNEKLSMEELDQIVGGGCCGTYGGVSYDVSRGSHTGMLTLTLGESTLEISLNDFQEALENNTTAMKATQLTATACSNSMRHMSGKDSAILGSAIEGFFK